MKPVRHLFFTCILTAAMYYPHRIAQFMSGDMSTNDRDAEQAAIAPMHGKARVASAEGRVHSKGIEVDTGIVRVEEHLFVDNNGGSGARRTKDRKMPPPSDNSTETTKKPGSSILDDIRIPSYVSSSENFTAHQPPVRRWAYAFLIGGCDPNKPNSYLGFLYNALVSAKILRDSGSIADVVVMVQISAHASTSTLPDEDVRLLTALNVRIQYLPKPDDAVDQSFYAVVLEKFRVLDLIEYSRVIFMDSDLMPFCSLDYLFELSEPEVQIGDASKNGPKKGRRKSKANASQLKENMVLSWKNEPSNCGFFMIKPGVGELKQLQSVISRQQREALELPWPHFDSVRGWGHVIEGPDDYWRSYRGIKGSNWTWHGVFGGQGLLYYWTKYVKRSVSLVTKSMVENWIAADAANGTLSTNETNSHDVRLEKVMWRPFDGRSCVPKDVATSGTYASVDNMFRRGLPYRDFFHFTGTKKPWEQKLPHLVASKESATSAMEYWYHVLGEIKKEVGMPYLDLMNMKLGKPALGRYPMYIDMLQTAKKRTNGD